MEKEFITYELAVELKKIGFDEPCIASWNFYTKEINYNGHPSTFTSEDVVQLPLYQQVFRWFREKYDLREQYGVFPHHTIMFNYMFNGGVEEEAELECLKKLIEIVRKNEVNSL